MGFHGHKYLNLSSIWDLEPYYLGPIYPYIIPIYPFISPYNPFKGTLLFGPLDSSGVGSSGCEGSGFKA